MGHFAITSQDATRYLQARRTDTPISLSTVTRTKGSTQNFDMDVVGSLRIELESLKEQFPATLPSRSRQGGRFEELACAPVHRAIGLLPSTAKTDAEFWIWLAAAWFADIIDWRFGGEEGVAKLANFGVAQVAENMLFRLWLRGEIGYDAAAEDPYRLARAGDQDLWRSHIIRQNYANARSVARSLLRLQAGELGVAPLATGDIRRLAKDLKRTGENVLFGYLNQAAIDALVLELHAEIRGSG